MELCGRGLWAKELWGGGLWGEERGEGAGCGLWGKLRGARDYWRGCCGGVGCGGERCTSHSSVPHLHSRAYIHAHPFTPPVALPAPFHE
eukprot:scaffold7368_cov143-Isochrysis_galbana.AAC.1